MDEVSSPSSEEITVVYDNSVDEVKAINSSRQPILFPPTSAGATPTLQEVLEQGSTGQVPTEINIQAVEEKASLSSYDDTGGTAISILDLDATDTGSAYMSLRNENEDGDFQELEFSSASSGVGSMVVRDQVKSKGLENAADYSANSNDRSLIDKEEIKGLIKANNALNFSFGSDTKMYLKGKETTYEALAQFTYEGTTNLGVPTNAIVRLSNKGTVTSNVRIFDVDNAQVIAEVTGFDPTIEEVFETIDMGALANLPTTSTTFEVQLSQSSGGGGKETWVGSLLIK
jgi:hypothetical protein